MVMDWYSWHEGYDDGSLAGRLGVVRSQLTIALNEAPPGPVRIISVCAGQGHDVLDTLATSTRRAETRALLVELDPRNVSAARERAAGAGLTGIAFRQGDAGLTDPYASMVPAQIVVVCGVFGSLTDGDIDRTVSTLPQLCAPKAQIIWTANRAAEGLFDHAVRSFSRNGFRDVWHSSPSDDFGVARHQLDAEPQQLRLGQRMFEFADEQTLIRLGRAKAG